MKLEITEDLDVKESRGWKYTELKIIIVSDRTLEKGRAIEDKGTNSYSQMKLK